MTSAAPPPWVKAAPGLSAAHKFMLQVLWGYGPYAREELWVTIDGDRQPRTPARCWESCEELARLTDQPAGTVRKQLRKLAADGWILRGSGSMRTLAWRAPGVFAYGAGGKSAHPLSTGAPGQECSPPVHTGPPSDHEVPPNVTTGAPQTFHELPIEPSSNVEEARDPHPDDVWLMRDKSLDPAPAPPKVKPDSPRLQACEQSAVLDPWSARVLEASQSAHYYLDLTADSTHDGSYSQLMRKARADYGDAGVLAALRMWEEEPHRSRPPAGKIWNSTWRAWVEGVLGIAAPNPEAAEPMFAFHPKTDLAVVGGGS